MPGVEPRLLDPFKTWKDGAEFDRTARDLVDMFQKNFARSNGDHAGYQAAAPEVRFAAE